MRPTVKEIAQAAAAHYQIPAECLLRGGLKRKHAHPRQLVMYLARKLGGRSYPEIGAAMNRDHTTVMFGMRRAEERLADAEVMAALLAISAETTRIVRERGDRTRALAVDLHIEQAKTLTDQMPVQRLPRTPAAPVPAAARWTLHLYDRQVA